MDVLQDVFEVTVASQQKITFVIVGVGGTGGYLVRDLARVVSGLNSLYETNNKIVLIDADQVRCLT